MQGKNFLRETAPSTQSSGRCSLIIVETNPGGAHQPEIKTKLEVNQSDEILHHRSSLCLYGEDVAATKDRKIQCQQAPG